MSELAQCDIRLEQLCNDFPVDDCGNGSSQLVEQVDFRVHPKHMVNSRVKVAGCDKSVGHVFATRIGGSENLSALNAAAANEANSTANTSFGAMRMRRLTANV